MEKDQPKRDAQPSGKPPTEDTIRSLWQKYIDIRRGESAEIDINTLGNSFDYQEGKITLQLHQGLEEEIFKRQKNELMQFLKKESGYHELTINIDLQELSNKKILYTAQEKFNFLAEKYPRLLELKQKLGLDVDF